MSDTCYACGAAATSVDHVPPRVLFPEQKDLLADFPDGPPDLRRNLITVPSCETHNTAQSKDDEYVAFVIAAHWANNGLGTTQWKTKILRALSRSTALALLFTASAEKIVFAGVETGRFKIDRPRFDATMEKVARGLYFHETGSVWTEKIRVHTTAFLLEDADLTSQLRGLMVMARLFLGDPAVAELARSMGWPVLPPIPPKGENSDVFSYQFSFVPEGRMFAIRMLFYGGFEVVALGAPGLD